MKITIIGTGYVGLVTGACFAHVGNSVTCLDKDEKKIEKLRQGKLPIYEPGLKKIVNENIVNKNLFFSSNTKNSIKKSKIIFVCVGTPMKKDGSSDLSFIKKVAIDIGDNINENKIIVMKSTVPVGTTETILKIINKELLNRSKKYIVDIANNPEFLKEGKGVGDFMSPDRIIVGLNNHKLKSVFKSLYRPFSVNHEKLIFMDVKSSELTKYAANAMLATKISFINEMAIIAENLDADINSIREGIGSDSRIGFSFIYPSAGYGGSCFNKDLNSLISFSKKVGLKPKIVNAVNQVNLNQNKYFFNKIIRRFKIKSMRKYTFGIWGLSYKPDTDDIRNSISINIVEKLIKLNSEVRVYDPKSLDNAKLYLKDNDNITFCKNKYEAVKGADALILLTEWLEFRSPDFKKIKSHLKKPIIFDGKNQYDKYDMQKRGFEYHQIGARTL